MSVAREGGAPIARLRNIGRESAALLAGSGVATVGDLERLGAVEAYVRVRRRFPGRASVVLLYGLVAGLNGMAWNELPSEARDALREEVREVEAATTLQQAPGRVVL